MEVKEIIRKINLQEDEMMFVIEQYIKEKRDVDFRMLSCILIISAYETACEYFFKKGY